MMTMTNNYRHRTAAGVTRRWLAILVVLLVALGSPLAAWAATDGDEPEVTAAEATDEPAEEPPAEEAPAEEAPAEEAPAEEPEPAPEPEPEPPANPDGQSGAVEAAQTKGGGGGGETAAQAEALADEPGATSANGVTPTFVEGNPSCPAGTTELKVEPPAAGQYTDGTLIVNMTTSDTPPNGSIGWTSNIGIDYVIVKGGPNASLYSYSPESTGDSGLTSPFNPNNGQYYGVSHVSFCYDVEETGSLDVAKVVDGTGSPEPGTEFTIDVDCDDDAYDATLVFDEDGNLTSGSLPITGIPLGTECTVTETGTGDADSVTYSPDGGTPSDPPTVEITSDGQEVTVTVTNTFIEVLGDITDRDTDTDTDTDVTTTEEGGTLAFTGAELLILALMALALVLVGTPLVILTRRRSE
ncbi:MAG TPA: DUF5979 domain-containing protein [Actinomycetota bacterium]